MSYITYPSFKNNLLADEEFKSIVQSFAISKNDIEQLLTTLFEEFRNNINTPSVEVNYRLIQDMINQQLLLSKVNTVIDTTAHKRTVDIYNNDVYVVSIDKTLIYHYSNGKLIDIKKSIYNPSSKYFNGLFVKNNN